MTPKEAYEVRKAERKAKRANSGGYVDSAASQEAIEELFDRFVTAAERIADALERQSSPIAKIEPWTTTGAV